MSVRARLTATAVLVVGIALVAGGAALVWVLGSALTDQVCATAKDRAAEIAAQVAHGNSSGLGTAGELVRVVIRSTDGVHGFSIPKLKIDVQVPKGGNPVTVEFTAPAAGRYEIACSEFCGSGHGQMKAALISVAPVTTNR